MIDFEIISFVGEEKKGRRGTAWKFHGRIYSSRGYSILVGVEVILPGDRQKKLNVNDRRSRAARSRDTREKRLLDRVSITIIPLRDVFRQSHVVVWHKNKNNFQSSIRESDERNSYRIISAIFYDLDFFLSYFILRCSLMLSSTNGAILSSATNG